MTTTQLKIRIYGDHCLRKKSELVKEVGVSERVLIKSMIETMYEQKGIGLAAPQVGINRQIFVCDVGEGPVAVINPKILKRNGSGFLEEGCLSIPDVLVKVKRPEVIDVRYVDEDNRVVECQYSDIMARVFLHETDHLFGKLIVDYASFLEKMKLKKQLQMLTKESKTI